MCTFETLRALVLGVLASAIIVFGIYWLYVEDQKAQVIINGNIASEGYDVGDVEVYLGSIGHSKSDFLKSQTLRKHYELFRDGLDTEFTVNARQAKAAKDARNKATSSAFVGGMVGGMVGSSMSGD